MPELKFIYSEKATKLSEISTVDLTVTTYDKSKMVILQKFASFSQNLNFNKMDASNCRQNTVTLSNHLKAIAIFQIHLVLG